LFGSNRAFLVDDFGNLIPDLQPNFAGPCRNPARFTKWKSEFLTIDFHPRHCRLTGRESKASNMPVVVRIPETASDVNPRRVSCRAQRLRHFLLTFFGRANKVSRLPAGTAELGF